MTGTALFFLLTFFSGCILTFTKRPIYGLYTYIFTFYFNPPGKWWGGQVPDIGWVFLIAVITIAAIFITKETEDKLIFFKYTENKLFLLFIIWVQIQYFFALSTITHIFYMVLCIKFYLTIFMIQNAIKNERDVIGFIVINILCTGYFGYQAMGGGRFEHIKVPALDDSNALAMHFAAILLMASFLFLASFGKKIFLLAPFVGLTLNAVILGNSRGAIISLIITGIVASVFMTKSGKRKFYVYGVLAVLSISLLAGEALLSKFSTIISKDDSGVEQDKSAESRLVIISAQWEMFKDSPILGYGHQGTLLLSPAYISEDYMASGSTDDGEIVHVRASHNLLFSLMVDHGLIGALIYISVMAVAMSKLLKIKRKEVEGNSKELLKVLILGLCFSLMLVWLAGMGTNNKVLEIDIWLYALIPVVYEWYKKNHCCPVNEK